MQLLTMNEDMAVPKRVCGQDSVSFSSFSIWFIFEWYTVCCCQLADVVNAANISLILFQVFLTKEDVLSGGLSRDEIYRRWDVAHTVFFYY